MLLVDLFNRNAPLLMNPGNVYLHQVSISPRSCKYIFRLFTAFLVQLHDIVCTVYIHL